MKPLKERIIDYWGERSDAFSAQRMRELSDVKHEQWLAEIARYLPKGRPLRVLDLGTGTGFFAMILAAEGHAVTGIDLTPGMIERAKETAAILGVDAEFFVMDAEEPSFPDESFDVLVTRNLTWTLPHLAEAYHAWYHLLKPGGVLINFDADYGAYIEDADPEDLPDDHAHKTIPERLMQTNEAITMEVSAYHQARPQWDVQVLFAAGFRELHIDQSVWERIYNKHDEFYNPTPIFTIAAYK